MRIHMSPHAPRSVRTLAALFCALAAGCYGKDSLPDMAPDQSIYFIPDMAAPRDLALPPDMFTVIPHPPSACAVSGETAVTTDTTYGFDWYWDTDHYELIYNTGTNVNGGTLRGVQLSAAGVPMGSVVDLDTITGASINPQLARTATGYVAAWEIGSPGSKVIRARTLNSDGSLTAIATSNVASSIALESRPSVFYARNNIAIAWMDVAPSGLITTQLGFLDSSTLALKTSPAAIMLGDGTGTTENKFPNIVGDANSLAVTWTQRENTTGASANTYIGLFNADLTVASSSALRAGVPNDAALPRVIKTQTGYYSAWEDGRIDPENYLQVYAVTTDQNGVKQLETLVPDPDTGDANWPNMVTRGTNIAVVYYQYRSGSDPNIYMSYLDAQGHHVTTGAEGGDVLVSSTPAGKQARFPDIQLAGNDFGIAWIDTRNGTPQVYFAKVTCP